MPDDRYRRGLVGRSAPSPDDHWTDGLDGVPIDGRDNVTAAQERRRRARARTRAARDERAHRRADEVLWRESLCKR